MPYFSQIATAFTGELLVNSSGKLKYAGTILTFFLSLSPVFPLGSKSMVTKINIYYWKKNLLFQHSLFYFNFTELETFLSSWRLYLQFKRFLKILILPSCWREGILGTETLAEALVKSLQVLLSFPLALVCAECPVLGSGAKGSGSGVGFVYPRSQRTAAESCLQLSCPSCHLDQIASFPHVSVNLFNFVYLKVQLNISK